MHRVTGGVGGEGRRPRIRGKVQMAYYQLYHYAEGRRFEHTDRFAADDDYIALDKARAKASGHEMELWCGPRRVRVYALAESHEG